MGVKSRRKGANGELEFIKLLSDSFPSYEFQRNYDQAAKSGFDVKGLPKFGIEVKRYKRGRLYQLDWWEQVVEAVKPHRLLPMLAYRFDRTEWNILVPAQWVVGNEVDRHDITCHMPYKDFIKLYEKHDEIEKKFNEQKDELEDVEKHYQAFMRSMAD